MPGENPSQPASAAPAQPATPPAQPAVAAPAQPASSTPAPILGADPAQPSQPAAPASPAAAAVPDKYELKAPEGQTLDAATLEAFTPVFKELGLSQEAAQKLVDTQFKTTAAALDAANKTMADQIAAETASWAKACRDDKEFGGANYDANVKIANKAFAAFAPPGSALRSVLYESGYANHPEFVRLFWTLGQKLSESAPPASGVPTTQKTAPERVLYPSMNS
jgi:hypothetical protein